jgi:surface protein
MFSGCSYFNQNISNWDVSKVTDMNRMFLSCYTFDQPLDGWNVNPTNNMVGMFAYCSKFNQPTIIEKWNLLYMPNENKEYMFYGTLMKNSVIMNKLPTKPNTMKEDDIKADDTIERVLYYKINPNEIPTACSICGQVIEEGGFAPTKCQNKYHYKCLFDKCNGQTECKCNCGRKLIFPLEQIGFVDEANVGNDYPVKGGKTKRRSKKNQRKTRKSRKNKK